MTAAVPAVPLTVDVDGIALHAGHIVVQTLPDGTTEQHRIDHLREYPHRRDGRPQYLGGHARIAYDSPDELTAGWRHTVPDNGHFHILTEG